MRTSAGFIVAMAKSARDRKRALTSSPRAPASPTAGSRNQAKSSRPSTPHGFTFATRILVEKARALASSEFGRGPARRNVLKIRRRSVAEERNDAAKQRDEPATEYGHAKQGVEHFLPDFLVGRQLIGCKRRQWRYEQHTQPEETRVAGEKCRFILIAHNKLRRSPLDSNLLRKSPKASAFVTDAAAAFAGLLRRDRSACGWQCRQSNPPGLVADRQ